MDMLETLYLHIVQILISTKMEREKLYYAKSIAEETWRERKYNYTSYYLTNVS